MTPRRSAPPLPDVRVVQTQNGAGVIAARSFQPGEMVLTFHGPILHRSQLPKPYYSVPDHYVQIGPDTYLGPSGGADDFVNHSCDPNSGLRIHGTIATLIAIRAIAEGEEVTWDYSTTMSEDEWEIPCTCGASNCRKHIRDYKHLPKTIRRQYERLGIVPPYAAASVKDG